MKLATHNITVSMGTLISIVVICMVLVNQPTYAENAQTVCERPVFTLWKSQQSNRLWEPTEETLAAEQSGRVFTYNCFTEKEIDMFFASHENRIEHAHFYPILSSKAKGLDDSEDDDEDCD